MLGVTSIELQSHRFNDHQHAHVMAYHPGLQERSSHLSSIHLPTCHRSPSPRPLSVAVPSLQDASVAQGDCPLSAAVLTHLREVGVTVGRCTVYGGSSRGTVGRWVGELKGSEVGGGECRLLINKPTPLGCSYEGGLLIKSVHSSGIPLQWRQWNL